MTPTSKRGTPSSPQKPQKPVLIPGHGVCGAARRWSTFPTAHACDAPSFPRHQRRGGPQANPNARHVPEASRTVLPALWVPLFTRSLKDAGHQLYPQHLRKRAFPPGPPRRGDCGFPAHGPQHGPACSRPAKGAATVTCAEGRTCAYEPHTVPTQGAWTRIRESIRRDHEHSMSSVRSVLPPAPCLENVSKTRQPPWGTRVTAALLPRAPEDSAAPAPASQFISLSPRRHRRAAPQQVSGARRQASKVRQSEGSHALARLHGNRKSKAGNQG